jgi:hypothetical protein
MNGDIELTEREENLRDAMKDDGFFERQCHSTNSAGERCASTIHLTGLHTWEH